MHLTNTELELAAVSISIAAGCVPCTRFHMAAAKKAGADGSEILQCLYVGIDTANDALAELQRLFDPEAIAVAPRSTNRTRGRVATLAAIGASIARNSVNQLEQSIQAARAIQLSDDEIMKIVVLANRIKEKAASHLQPVTNKLDADPAIGNAVASLCT